MNDTGKTAADGAQPATAPGPRPLSLNDAGPAPASLSDRVRSLRIQAPARNSLPAATWISWVLFALLIPATAYLVFRDITRETSDRQAVAANSPGSGDTANSASPAKDVAPGEIAHTGKGYLVAVSLVQVSPLVGARVTELKIYEGLRVKKGQVLATLETEDYEPDVRRAEGVLAAAQARLRELKTYREEEAEQAQAELEECKAQLFQLQHDYQRNLDLKNRSAVAPRDFDLAVSAFRAMENKVRRLELAYRFLKERGPRDERIASVNAEIDQARADLKRARWKLDNCVIKAPTNGIILSKKAEEGNMVNPSAFSNGLSASLCEMADLTKLEVDLAIAERDISNIFQYQECQAWAEGLPDRKYKGFVSRIMPQADQGKGAVPVRVRICGISREEEGAYLRPQMGGIARFFNKKMDQKEIDAELNRDH